MTSKLTSVNFKNMSRSNIFFCHIMGSCNISTSQRWVIQNAGNLFLFLKNAFFCVNEFIAIKCIKNRAAPGIWLGLWKKYLLCVPLLLVFSVRPPDRASFSGNYIAGGNFISEEAVFDKMDKKRDNSVNFGYSASYHLKRSGDYEKHFGIIKIRLWVR